MGISTRAIESRLNSTRLEVGEAEEAGIALSKAIEHLVADFIQRHGGDLEDTLKGINDSLSDLLDSVTKPKLGEIEDLEHALADIERADLRRSSPVVL